MGMCSPGKDRKAFNIKSFRDVIAPIYYRHEFARRNETVKADSKAVMQVFSCTAALTDGTGFIRKEGEEYATLVGDLTKEFYAAPEAEKAKMRAVLGEYVRVHRLLPILPPPQRFFPESMSVHDGVVSKAAGVKKPTKLAPKDPIKTELTAIWRSLVQYERLLLTEGLVDEPCFMPVVPLPQFGDGMKMPSMISERLGKLAGKRLLVAFDTSATWNVLDYSHEIMMAHSEALETLRRDEAAKRRERKVQWRTFEIILQAYIREYEQAVTGDIDQRAIDFSNTVMPSKITIKSSSRKQSDALNKYKGYQNAADSHIKRYKDIGKTSAS